MSVRSLWKNEFPPGWWRCRRWWFAGSAQMGRNMAISVATFAYWRSVRDLVAVRRDPRALVAHRLGDEAVVGGVLVSIAMLLILVPAMLSAPLGISLLLLNILVFVVGVNLVLCLLALVVLVRSRLAHPRFWQAADAAARHAPRYGRPPETMVEYQALAFRQRAGIPEQKD